MVYKGCYPPSFSWTGFTHYQWQNVKLYNCSTSPNNMKLLIVTDIHEQGEIVNEIISREGVDVLLSCGDQEGYYEPPIPCYFVNGNHEDFPLIGTMKQNPKFSAHPNLHLITPENPLEISIGDDYFCVAGLGGIYNPQKYQRHVDQSYFTRHEVDTLRGCEGSSLDILLFHETLPSFGIKRHGKIMGCPPLDKTVKLLKPKLVFCGHHDEVLESKVGKSTTIQLSQPSKSYCIVYAGKFGVESYEVKTPTKHFAGSI